MGADAAVVDGPARVVNCYCGGVLVDRCLVLAARRCWPVRRPSPYTLGMTTTPDQTPTDADLPAMPMVAPGLYRHYKGGEYKVLDMVRHSETLEAMVLYQALYGQRGLWVRPAAMFAQTVTVDGVEQPRFALLPTAEQESHHAG